MARESCASSACFSARVCSAIARDCSPRANAMRPCSRHERGELGVGDLLPQRVGRAAKGGGRLSEVVLKEPGLGQRGPDAQLVFATERARSQHAEAGGAAPHPGRARARHCARASVGEELATATAGVYKVYKRREGYNRGPMPLAAYGVTHQGRRSTNEDAWLVDLGTAAYWSSPTGWAGTTPVKSPRRWPSRSSAKFSRDGTPQVERLDEALQAGQRPRS